ncbi:c-type cytochrome biogenesis protein CcsB [Rothia sp. AR01]|uniref:C-type cytochrome biogenesis protein CcsB n=1 Tax=Rothia santali TaxID=2949643 RepID=A0A9X2HC83_9MICC|nr:c-type cytochrome biogenesis protein CcsB [Rothia santali]MCP3425037.1 c-type cytochrome biogenesis protein CcsB [Rothia santali]
MTINESLAQWSELSMLLAAVTYLVAFIAFTWDIASHSKAARRADAAGRRAESAKRPAMAGAGPAAERGSAAGFDDAGSGTLSGTEDDAAQDSWPVDSSMPGDLDRVSGRRTADDSMVYSGARRPAANVAVAVMVIGVLIHLAGVLTRGLAASRVPWGNMYEFCTTGALVVSVVFLIALIFRDLRFVGTLVSGLAVVMMVAATIGFPTPVGHLQPALQSYWLVIHVSVAVMASGVFTITFALAVLQLMQTRRERRLAEGGADRMPFMRLVPSARALENFAFRLNTVGFVMWTFTLAMGAIWAEQAWGRYWGWDTKEVWTFVIWVVYAAYLHARATRGWTGPRSAWLSIIGYLCIIFNFTVVNVFFSGLHSYSGL